MRRAIEYEEDTEYGEENNNRMHEGNTKMEEREGEAKKINVKRGEEK